MAQLNGRNISQNAGNDGLDNAKLSPRAA